MSHATELVGMMQGDRELLEFCASRCEAPWVDLRTESLERLLALAGFTEGCETSRRMLRPGEIVLVPNDQIAGLLAEIELRTFDPEPPA